MPIQLTVSFGANQNGQWRGYFNGIDYVPQKVPTLYTAMNAPLANINTPSIYGANSNPYVLPMGAVVEVTIQNHDAVAHPFHLHGHNFQVISRSAGSSNFPISIPAGAPMRRDTVQVMSDGSATIRFVADNPGIALLHCHIEFHVEAGLTATFIEAPTELQAKRLYLPVSHRSVCDEQRIPRKGNAAGNSANYLDLTGANTVADTASWGRVIFSCHVYQKTDDAAELWSSSPPSQRRPSHSIEPIVGTDSWELGFQAQDALSGGGGEGGHKVG